jgi:hypothetical protein
MVYELNDGRQVIQAGQEQGLASQEDQKGGEHH